MTIHTLINVKWWRYRVSFYIRDQHYEKLSFNKMFRYKEVQLNFSDIFRVFISGSSASGKTYFARRLLEQKLFDFDRVYYFHPDFHETSPVDWSFDILYHPGLPTLEDLLAIPEKSCLIFDDLYHECVNSNEIDYLYRVLSSKRKLHCIVMTQRYFAQGKHAVSIRNSSNYQVLMRNADERINLRAADSMNLKQEVVKANECNENEMYPYIFIDRSNQARVTGIKVYIDLFSKYMKIIMKSGLKFIIDAPDFHARFKLIDNNVAVENETSRERLQKSTENCQESSTKSNTTQAKSKNSRYSRRELTRRVKQALYRHKQRTIV